MRLPLVFTVALAVGVLGQTSTEPEPDVPDVTTPAPEPTTRPSPTIIIDSTPPPTTESTTFTSTEAETTTLATSLPPSGGGATCVQRCLAQAATQVACGSSANLACLCESGTYLSIARTCFTDSGCAELDSQAAVRDYGSACTATTTTPADSSSPMPTRSTSRTRTNTGSLTSLTTQTLAFTSGAVVSISGGRSSTIASGFTTVRTGQAGDFATDRGVAPTSGTDNGSTPNGAVVNTRQLASAGMMLGLGLVGGMVVLVL